MAFLIEERRGTPTHVCTRQDVERVCKSRYVTDHILEFRRTKDGTQKSTLPGFVFSAIQMVDHEWIDSKGKNRGVAAWRHQDWALVNGLIMCDFDHLENPVELFEQKLLPLKEKWGIKMVYITPSGFGLKCAFEAKAEIGDIAANQQAFAAEAGLELDEVCIDASRLSFVPLWNDILLLEDSLFTYENQEFIEKYTKQYFKGTQSCDLFGGNLDFSEYRYCDLEIPLIIDRLLGGMPVKEGMRHDTIFQLSKKLRYVCERSKDKVAYFLFKLKWVVDLDKEDHNVMKTIEDAMNKPYSSYMPKDLYRIIKELKPDAFVDKSEDYVKPWIEFGERIEALMDKFPCLREICMNMEKSTFAAALYVAAAFFGTLMTRCWYYFWFDPMIQRRLNYCIFIIGDPGAGKSFADTLFEAICAPMIKDDELGNTAINNFKLEKKAWDRKSEKQKNADNHKLEEPHPIIRIHGPRTANGVFIEDMVRAKEVINGEIMQLHLLTFNTELDSMTIANKGGQWIDKTSMEILAFHNEKDNQQYKNQESVTGPFKVFWNFVYTGTPIALDRKVNERNFGSGLFSRLGCVPFATNYFKSAGYRKRTKTDEVRLQTIKEWADKLYKVWGELPVDPLNKATADYVDELLEIAEFENNKADAFLTRRISYYGINISIPFILMRHWDEWCKTRSFKCDKYDIALCKLVMDIQMHSQRYFFGKFAEAYWDNSMRRRNELQVTEKTNVYKEILNKLPNEFTYDDVMTATSKPINSCRSLVKRLVDKNFIIKICSNRNNSKWQKL